MYFLLYVRTRHLIYFLELVGNARASFTPRKPGRSSSVREDEKRKAPNPPSIVVPEGGKVAKGPAPMVPQLIDPKNHDYEYIAGSTPEKVS